MSKRIVIIGGGVIGLTAAWYLQNRGHQITVVDRQSKDRDGCSFGNSGIIVPSHFVTLAAPGMIRLGLKWMWNPESPFSIRPRASLELLHWLWNFKRACTQRHVQRAAPLLRDLHLASRDCFEQLHSELPEGICFVQNGLLMLCQTQSSLREETDTAELAERLNIETQVLDARQTADLDPNIEMDVLGAVYYPRDCHLSPNRLMTALQTHLGDGGCQLLWDRECTGFSAEGHRIRAVQTTTGEIDSDEVLLCGGAWTSTIAKDLGLSLPMQAGKGYSFTLDQPRQLPSTCSILTEARIAVTPLGAQLRFGGTMEIAGLDHSITDSRVRGLVRSIPRYFPRFSVKDFERCEPWVGLRPCSPDGLPYLGRSSRWKNLLISSGHAMMGVSLAMISGRIVSEMIDDLPMSIPNLEMLSPDRYMR